MSSCELPSPVKLIHSEFRFDTPHNGEEYRIVAVDLAPNDFVAIATKAADSDTATTEISFRLADAQFFAQRILAGDMEAARRPGMSRLLAAALIVCLKILIAQGLIAPEKAKPKDGEGEDA